MGSVPKTTTLEFKKSPTIWIGGWLVVVLVIGAIGLYFRHIEQAACQRDSSDRLAAIAHLKSQHIADWRQERQADTERCASSALLLDAVRLWLDHPDDPRIIARLLQHLQVERTAADYADVLLTDRSGRPWFSAASADSEAADRSAAGPSTRALALAANRDRRVMFGDLYRHTDGRLRLDVAAPLIDPSDGRNLGALVLAVDPYRVLFPLVQSWPLPTQTAETLLVERDHDEVIFLNSLRFDASEPLTVRLPLARTAVPAVQAALGRVGEWTGTDYRGMPVLAQLRPVPGSPWIMVAKIGIEESLHEARIRVRTVTLATLLALVLATAITAGAYQQRQRTLFQRLYASERNRANAQEEFRTILYSIGDGVISADASGNVRNMNAVAEALTGWRESEARARPLGEVFHIVNEDTRLEVESPVDRVLRERKVVGLANHTLLIAKDGAERPIADSGAPVFDATGALRGVVLVFRDQTAERAADIRAQHVSQVLETIRGVGQLILREGSAERLIQQACQMLIDRRGCLAAWFAWAPDGGAARAVAGAGWPGFEEFAARLEQNHWPPCREQARAAPHGVVQLERDRACQECPLGAVGDSGAAVCSWICGSPEVGLLGFVLPAEDALGDDERVLLRELGQDLAKALHLREVEAQRRQSEERFKTSFEHASVAKSLTGLDGRLTWVNEAFCALFGYRREELTSMSLADLAFPDGRAAAESMPGLSSTEGPAQQRFEERYVRKDGTTVWADVSRVLLRDEAGQPQHLVTEILDVSKRKLSEEALQALSSRHEAILSAIPDIIVALDAQQVYTWANRAGLEFFGDGLLGREASYYLEGDQSASGPTQQPQVDGQENTCYVENWQRRSDGRRRLLAWWCKVLRDPTGRLLGALSTARDITDQRNLEAAASQSDRLASMGLLAAGVSHEINNPLSYVLYHLGSLVRTLPRLARLIEGCHQRFGNRLLEVADGDAELVNPAATAELVGQAREALQGVERIKRIVGSLGSFSRTNQGTKAPVDLVRAVEHAAAMAANEIRFRARLVLELRPVPPVAGSEGKLAQVFLNLLINAAHSIEEGRIDHNQIRVRTWEQAGQVYAEVTDTGSGIPAANLERIFEPFFTTNRPGMGTGLGLAITRSLIAELGGEISVSSVLGQGTTFLVRLPASVSKPTAARSVARQAEEVVATDLRGRILIVDDEDGIRNVVGRVLSGCHDIVSMRSAEDAKRLLEQDRNFDLVLCDVMMPGMSGMDLHAWLREHGAQLAERVVFMTGGAFTPRAAEYLAHSGCRQIQKPFAPTDLRLVAMEAVRAARTHAAPRGT